ncbi:NAD(P)H-dependent glycerol-3-phosphate dehydrogenase [Terriglobus tenax]|uniref:NAD(P)H-dependent glycerol-3-phosphate dehydrogenase n=1 Tax=Terriglobus tenax TaxID=1111115 RepID=UPI0021E03398|nr:NAD(P)H-dependent glycerol-3-phosphate dehydrogenase [Terriglobus tenax]
MSRIAVLGAGAWGTALMLTLARRGGHELTLWAHSEDEAVTMRSTRQNKRFLPGFSLPADLAITSSLEEAVPSAEVLLCVVPSEHLRATFVNAASLITPQHAIVSATKGIEQGTFLRMSQVIEELTPAKVAALSGPSFAQEVAEAMPTVVTIAAKDHALAKRLQEDFSSSTFRTYANEDIVGVELGGALKNVIALAAGVVAGLGLGHNVAAALMTRGIAEITRLAVACGGKPETLAGLSGLGDLVLTCTGSLSRNRTVGMELGKGRKLPEIIASLDGKVAEGVRSTSAALGLARRHGVEMPITQQMDAVLHEGKAPMDAIHALMTRSLRTE